MRSVLPFIMLFVSSLPLACASVETPPNYEEALANANIAQEKLQKEMEKTRALTEERDKCAKQNEALVEKLQAYKNELTRYKDYLSQSEVLLIEAERVRKKAYFRYRLYHRLKEDFQSLRKQGKLTLLIHDGLFVVRIALDELFKTNRRTIRYAKGGKQLFKAVAEILKGYPEEKFLILAHTDDSKPEPRRYESNLWLSANFAHEAYQALEADGVEKERLIIGGHGETLPIMTNDTSTGRKKNRRLEIVVWPDYQDIVLSSDEDIARYEQLLKQFEERELQKQAPIIDADPAKPAAPAFDQPAL